MAGMRDKVVHSYFGIDTEIVWLAVHDRIPAIRPSILLILNDLEEHEQYCSGDLMLTLTNVFKGCLNR